MTTYSACDGSFVPEWLARHLDTVAWLTRAYPLPSYETRCRLLAQERAAECQTDAQRRIEERRPDHPSKP